MALMALSAKELSLPLPLVDPRWRARICLFHFLERNHFASRMIIPVDTMRRNIFLENDVINQVKLTQINHIRKRKTSKRWIPSQRKEKVLTSTYTVCFWNKHNPHCLPVSMVTPKWDVKTQRQDAKRIARSKCLMLR